MVRERRVGINESRDKSTVSRFLFKYKMKIIVKIKIPPDDFKERYHERDI